MAKSKIIVFVAAFAIMLISGVMLLRSFMEYKTAEDEYKSLTEYLSSGGLEKSAGNQVGSQNEESLEEEKAVLPEGGLATTFASAGQKDIKRVQKELTRNYNREDFPDIEVDFEGLRQINNSLVCWVYLGGADINYPVVQCGDNEFYLHHTFEMKKNSSGCVFMDYEVDPELTSWNTFIYGHNMKNGTMFGHLKNYINNKNTYDKDKYIYIFRPEGIYRYEIFSYYLDSPDSKMYYTCDNLKEYRQYLRDATSMSVRECDAKADPDENIVTLVTCSGSGANKQRFFVHGVFKDRFLY